MKKLLIAVAILIGVFFAGLLFQTYDYGKTCIYCLRDYHVVEEQFCGVTFYRKSKLRDEGYPRYEEVFGHPCEHVYKTGGFGRSIGGIWGGGIGCGMTAEGVLFRQRKAIIGLSYRLSETTRETAPLITTIELMDIWFPETLLKDFSGDTSLVSAGQNAAFSWENDLQDVQTVEEWNTVIKNAQAKAEEYYDAMKRPRP